MDSMRAFIVLVVLLRFNVRMWVASVWLIRSSRYPNVIRFTLPSDSNQSLRVIDLISTSFFNTIHALTGTT